MQRYMYITIVMLAKLLSAVALMRFQLAQEERSGKTALYTSEKDPVQKPWTANRLCRHSLHGRSSVDRIGALRQRRSFTVAVEAP